MNGVFALLLFFTRYTAGKWKLPASAKITMRTARAVEGYSSDQYGDCSKRTLTERELRRKFATYHEMTGNEFTHDYQNIGCVIEGDIVVKGKHYSFSERPINLLRTTWPDGVLHQLGGKHSDQTDSQ